jgi:hypothetical protein
MLRAIKSNALSIQSMPYQSKAMPYQFNFNSFRRSIAAKQPARRMARLMAEAMSRAIAECSMKVIADMDTTLKRQGR